MTRIAVHSSADDGRAARHVSGGNPIPLGGLKFDGRGQTSARGDEITLANGEVESVDYIAVAAVDQ